MEVIYQITFFPPIICVHGSSKLYRSRSAQYKVFLSGQVHLNMAIFKLLYISTVSKMSLFPWKHKRFKQNAKECCGCNPNCEALRANRKPEKNCFYWQNNSCALRTGRALRVDRTISYGSAQQWKNPSPTRGQAGSHLKPLMTLVAGSGSWEYVC